MNSQEQKETHEFEEKETHEFEEKEMEEKEQTEQLSEEQTEQTEQPNTPPPNTEHVTEEVTEEQDLENREMMLVNDMPAHYNDDVYKDCQCDDNELRYQMIKRPVENDLQQHLYNYCDTNLEQRFRHVIQENKVLPLETTKKTLKLKLKKNTEKTRNTIRDTINETFSTYYPEKILTFINSTVQLLFLERMKEMEREFTCVHNGTYFHIKMESHYKKVTFGKSYTLVNVDIVTSKFE